MTSYQYIHTYIPNEALGWRFCALMTYSRTIHFVCWRMLLRQPVMYVHICIRMCMYVCMLVCMYKDVYVCKAAECISSVMFPPVEQPVFFIVSRILHTYSNHSFQQTHLLQCVPSPNNSVSLCTCYTNTYIHTFFFRTCWMQCGRAPARSSRRDMSVCSSPSLLLVGIYPFIKYVRMYVCM